MALSTIAKTKRDLTVVLTDAAGAHSLTITLERGDFNMTIPGPTVNVFLDRGRFGATPSLRYGDDQPCTWSISGDLTDVSDASYATLMGIIAPTQGYVGSTWVSTMGATGEVKTWTITVTIEGTDHGDSADHTIVMNFCAVTGSVADGDPCTVSLSGTSYVIYPTLT